VIIQWDQCPAGYVGAAENCVLCAAGSYVDASGLCTSCAPNLWSPAGSTAVGACIGCVDRSTTAILAGGGTETTDVPGYRVHSYTATGATTVTFGRDVVADVLVVGGGGSGGINIGGGGGAGAIVYYSGHKFTQGTTYAFTVGNGGAEASGTGTPTAGYGSTANPGLDSTIKIGTSVVFLAAGGGNGGSGGGSTCASVAVTNGVTGGNGGGAGGCSAGSNSPGSPSSTNALSSIAGYTTGKAGGTNWVSSTNANIAAGGGGGAGFAGGAAASAAAGTGGHGVYQVGWAGTNLVLATAFGSAYTSVADLQGGNYYIGGGGGGGGWGTATDAYVSGGYGGAGKGVIGTGSTAPTGALPSTGGGGGGGSVGSVKKGGAGGSGLILLRYSTCQACGAGQKLVNAGASGSCQACGGGEYSWSGASSCGSCPDNSVSNKGLGSDKCVASAGKYPLHTAPASYTTTSSTVTVTGKLFVVNNDYVGGSFWGLSGTVYVHIDPFANLAALIASPTILPAISDNDYPVVTDSAGAVVRPYVWYKFDSSVGCTTDSGTSQTTLDKSSASGANQATCQDDSRMRGVSAAKFYHTLKSNFRITPAQAAGWSLEAATASLGTGLTIALWGLMSSSNPTWSRFFSWETGTTSGSTVSISTGFIIGRAGTSKKFRFAIDTTSYVSSEDYNDDQWYHFVLSISSNGDWRIWIDGQQRVGTSTEGFDSLSRFNARIPAPASGHVRYFNLGISEDTGRLLNGGIDDFRIYKTVLTAFQVTTLYQGRVGVYTASFGNCPDTTTCTTGSKHCDKFGGKQCCVAGQYLQDGVDSACQQCPAGTYSLDGAGTSCTVCPNGKYVTTTGATSSAACTDCTATACASGYKRCKTSTTYECCGANTYFIEGTGMTACETCPTDLFSSGGGVTCITQCPAGQYEDAGACQGCPVGMFNAGP